jgi:RNA polymerase sigma factor (sigma-70 family)
MGQNSNISACSFRDELDRNFRLPLTAFFLRRTHSRVEAEDLTQEVFLRLLRNCDRVDHVYAKHYVFTAASNLLRDRARQAGTQRTLAFADLEQCSSPALIEEIDPERIVASKQSLGSVISALRSLDQRTRDIFVLYRIESMKQNEIAKLFGLSLSSVEKYLAKALAHLTEHVE